MRSGVESSPLHHHTHDTQPDELTALLCHAMELHAASSQWSWRKGMELSCSNARVLT